MVRRTQQLETLSEQTTHRLPRITRIARSGLAFQPTALTADKEVLALNLMRGCGQRCAFCSVRGSAHYSGDDELFLYDDSPEKLATELDTRPRLPRAIFISPATDPFPPLVEVQEQAALTVAALAERGVETWLMTRGLIRPHAMQVLAAHRDRVRVTVSMTTCDRQLQRTLEPWCASPRLRLKQIAKLRSLEIPVQVAIDPMIPGVTDTRSNLSAVLEAVGDSGVRHVTASYVYLREGIAKNLASALAPLGMDQEVLSEYDNGPVLTGPGLAAARYLPRNRRQRGYGMLISLAAGHGISVSFSGMTNPDFAPPRSSSASSQRLFPLFMQNK